MKCRPLSIKASAPVLLSSVVMSLAQADTGLVPKTGMSFRTATPAAPAPPTARFCLLAAESCLDMSGRPFTFCLLATDRCPQDAEVRPAYPKGAKR